MILEMSHNCALTSRHWGDDQIYKRAYTKGGMEGGTWITKRNNNKVFMNPLEVDLTIIDFLRYAFVLHRNTTALI